MFRVAVARRLHEASKRRPSPWRRHHGPASPNRIQRGTRMALRILARLADVFRDGASDDETVHFHQGPQSQPAVCYRPHCSSPRLSV